MSHKGLKILLIVGSTAFMNTTFFRSYKVYTGYSKLRMSVHFGIKEISIPTFYYCQLIYYLASRGEKSKHMPAARREMKGCNGAPLLLLATRLSVMRFTYSSSCTTYYLDIIYQLDQKNMPFKFPLR